MRALLGTLWRDEVGSTVSAEMALVTAVTVGALFMSMGRVGVSLQKSFTNSSDQMDVMKDPDEVRQRERREKEQEFRNRQRARELEDERQRLEEKQRAHDPSRNGQETNPTSR